MGEQNRIRQCETESLYLLYILSVQFYPYSIQAKRCVIFPSNMCLWNKKYKIVYNPIMSNLLHLTTHCSKHFTSYRWQYNLIFQLRRKRIWKLYPMSFRVVDGICPNHTNNMLLHEVLFLVLMQRNSNSCSRPNILVEKKYFVFSLLYTYIMQVKWNYSSLWRTFWMTWVSLR